jgi:hypothetical protein
MKNALGVVAEVDAQPTLEVNGSPRESGYDASLTRVGARMPLEELASAAKSSEGRANARPKSAPRAEGVGLGMGATAKRPPPPAFFSRRQAEGALYRAPKPTSRPTKLRQQRPRAWASWPGGAQPILEINDSPRESGCDTAR